MNLKKERELLVLTYLLEKRSEPFGEFQAGQEPGDEDVHFENTINDLIKAGYLEPASGQEISDQPEIVSRELTEKGKTYLKDLSLEKYEEKQNSGIYMGCDNRGCHPYFYEIISENVSLILRLPSPYYSLYLTRIQHVPPDRQSNGRSGYPIHPRKASGSPEWVLNFPITEFHFAPGITNKPG